VDYTLTLAALDEERGPKTKARDNIAAIRLLKTPGLTARTITPEQQNILAKYCGWGGLPQAFKQPDGSYKDGWEEIAREIETLLSPEELDAARRTTLDAHYTAGAVVAAMWEGALQMGFKGGVMLESSCGTGNFIGMMPQDLRDRTQVLAVEIDPTTARIASLLYPSAIVVNTDYQKFTLPDGAVDLNIGNPPFGSQKLNDPTNPFVQRFSANTHGYFVLKALEQLKPGGVQILVVSRFLLDAAGQRAVEQRRAIAQQADLLCAVRLPNTAFQQNAGTEVVTDVLVFQKRQTPLEMSPTEESAQWPAWTTTVSDMADDQGVPIEGNAWYKAHPDMILGKPVLGRGMHRENEPMVIPDGRNWIEELRARMRALPAGVMPEPSPPLSLSRGDPAWEAAVRVEVGDWFRYASPDGTQTLFARRDPDVAGLPRFTTQDLSEKDALRLQGLLDLAEGAQTLVDWQVRAARDDADLEAFRARLAEQYAAFVQRFGFLHDRANVRLIREDSRFARIVSLETNYLPAVSKEMAEKTGRPRRPASAEPALILRERTQWPVEPPTQADTGQAALSASLNWKGRIDWEYMRSLRQTSLEALRDELVDTVLLDPLTLRWDTADAVLSGPVREKLEEARRLIDAPDIEVQQRRQEADQGRPVQPEWSVADLERVEARLRAVLPETVPFSQITVPIGASWVPKDVVRDFAQHILQCEIPVEESEIQYYPDLGQWRLSKRLLRSYTASPEAASTFGTPHMSAGDILRHALSSRNPVVYGPPDQNGKRPVDQEATAFAGMRVKAIQREWTTWIGDDPARAARLEALYNQTFNSDVPRKYDGSAITIPGMSEHITLRPHQKNYIARALFGEASGMADHEVGSGKTFTLAALAYKLKQLGLAKKPCIAVPANLVGQWTQRFQELIPGARLLVSDDTATAGPAARQAFWAKAAYGDYDCLIVSHNMLGMLRNDPDFEVQFLQEEIARLERTAALVRNEEKSRANAQTVKQLERKKSKLVARISAISNGLRQDRGIHFGSVGIDWLFVDEADLFKNLWFTTQLQNVRGLGNPQGSARAQDMLLKVRFIQSLHGGRGGVHFATGTPLSNTLAEIYTWMRYLSNDDLVRKGLDNFPAWQSAFAIPQSTFSLTLDRQFKETTYLSAFVGLPELKAMWDRFVDTVTRADMVRMMAEAGMPPPSIPKLRGGQPQIVVCALSPEQQRIIGRQVAVTPDGEPVYEPGSLLHLVDNLPKTPTPGAPNILTVISDFRKVGLHAIACQESPGPRLPPARVETDRQRIQSLLDAGTYLPAEPEDGDDVPVISSVWTEKVKDLPGLDPGSKLSSALHHMMEIYKEYDADKGVQMVFLDFSTPNAKRSPAAAKAQREQAERIKALWDAVEKGQSEDATPDEVMAGELAAAQLETLDAEEIERSLALLKGEETSRWSAYEALRDGLLAVGVPAHEIAFIHDYDTVKARNDLFDKVRCGDVRFLFGSTAKLGAGVDVQDRLVALHHLDAPYRPRDVLQRNGRILRQGCGRALTHLNGKEFAVDIFYYVTKNSADAGLWEIIDRKDAFIRAFRAGPSGVRDIVDPESESFDPARVKALASGNALLMHKTQAEQRSKTLDHVLRGLQNERRTLHWRITEISARIDQMRRETLPAAQALAQVGRQLEQVIQEKETQFLAAQDKLREERNALRESIRAAKQAARKHDADQPASGPTPEAPAAAGSDADLPPIEGTVLDHRAGFWTWTPAPGMPSSCETPAGVSGVVFASKVMVAALRSKQDLIYARGGSDARRHGIVLGTLWEGAQLVLTRSPLSEDARVVLRASVTTPSGATYTRDVALNAPLLGGQTAAEITPQRLGQLARDIRVAVADLAIADKKAKSSLEEEEKNLQDAQRAVQALRDPAPVALVKQAYDMIAETAAFGLRLGARNWDGVRRKIEDVIDRDSASKDAERRQRAEQAHAMQAQTAVVLSLLDKTVELEEGKEDVAALRTIFAGQAVPAPQASTEAPVPA
jgi:N12 class adenine-specific DNA methylase/predicted RNA methylase